VIDRKDLVKVKEFLTQCTASEVNQKQGGVTPLFLACERNQPEIAEELLKSEASPDIKSRDGETPLYISILGGNTKCARVCVAYGANVNEYSMGCAPLRIL
jgi:ankyrin repeat protein